MKQYKEENKTQDNGQNMTAKVSCFARAFHCKENQEWVFADPLAEKMLGADYEAIWRHMGNGISFFAPDFQGTQAEAVRFIVDYQLAPSVLGRSAFCEAMLENELRLGCGQYVLFGAGYDTFAYRNTHRRLRVFELDRETLLADKKARAAQAGMQAIRSVQIGCDLSKDGWQQALLASGYEPEKKTFCSMLGLSYYLQKEELCALLMKITELLIKGSALVFDYPIRGGSTETRKNEALAMAAGETMQAAYTDTELERMLESCGFLIYEHLNAAEMTERYFQKYNAAHEKVQGMKAPEGVGYCMAVKKLDTDSKFL